MFQRAAFVSSILCCSLLASAVLAAEEPAWLKEARAREAKSLEAREIKSKDAWFQVRSPGKLANTVEKIEGSYSVELDIGSEANIQCEVYPEGIDLANALRLTAEGAFEEIGKTQGAIEARVLEASDAGGYGAVPYIAMTWLYRIATPEGAKLGSLKQFVMEKGDQGVYCAHNELGYTRTFASVTRAFAETLRVQDAAPDPYYVEISTATMSGVKVGVMAASLLRDAEGDSRGRHLMALIVATSDGNIQTQDSTHIEWVRPDDSLINASDTEATNGELTSNLALKEIDGAWLVDGEVQGKAIRTALPEESKPRSWVAQSRELRTLLASPDAVGREHSIDMWLAEDPGRLNAAKTKILANKDAKHVTALAEIGEIKANMVIEKTSGVPTVIEMSMGPVSLTLERAFVSGSF